MCVGGPSWAVCEGEIVECEPESPLEGLRASAEEWARVERFVARCEGAGYDACFFFSRVDEVNAERTRLRRALCGAERALNRARRIARDSNGSRAWSALVYHRSTVVERIQRASSLFGELRVGAWRLGMGALPLVRVVAYAPVALPLPQECAPNRPIRARAVAWRARVVRELECGYHAFAGGIAAAPVPRLTYKDKPRPRDDALEVMLNVSDKTFGCGGRPRWYHVAAIVFAAAAQEEFFKWLLSGIFGVWAYWLFGAVELFLYLWWYAQQGLAPWRCYRRLAPLLMHVGTGYVSGATALVVHFVWNFSAYGYALVGLSASLAPALEGVFSGMRHLMFEDMGGEFEVLLKVWPLLEVRSVPARLVLIRSMIRDLLPEYADDFRELAATTDLFGPVVDMFEAVVGGVSDLECEEAVTTTGSWDAVRAVASALGAAATDQVEVAQWPSWATTLFRLLVAAGVTRVLRLRVVPSIVQDVIAGMAAVGVRPGDVVKAVQDIVQRTLAFQKTRTLSSFFERSPTDPLVILQDAARIASLTDDGLADAVGQPNTTEYFTPRITRLEELVERVRKASITADVPTRAALMGVLRMLFDRLEGLERVAISAVPRRPPFTMLFAGTPGVGKSFLLRVIFSAVAAAFERQRDFSSMYFAQQGQKYYDDYRTVLHWFVVLDDLMSTNPDKVADAALVVEQIISFINVSASRLNAAEINNKQKRWAAPDCVVATTNVRDLNAKFYGVGDGMAIRRRFAWVIDVVVKPDYCKPGSTELDARRLPTDRIADAWVFTVNKVVVGATEQLVAVEKNLNLQELVVWVARSVIAHRAIAATASKALDFACDEALRIVDEVVGMGADREEVVVTGREVRRATPDWWADAVGHESWLNRPWTFDACRRLAFVAALCYAGQERVRAAVFRRETPLDNALLYAVWREPFSASHLFLYSLHVRWRHGVFPLADDIPQQYDLAIARLARARLCEGGVRGFERQLKLCVAVLGVAAAGVLAYVYTRPRRLTEAHATMLRELPAVIEEDPSTWQRRNARDAVGDPRVPGSDDGRVPEAVPRVIFRDPLPVQSATTPLDVILRALEANTHLFEFVEPTVVGTATCLGGFLYVTAAHNFAAWTRAGSVGALVRVGPFNGFLTERESRYMVDSSQVYFKPGADVAFFTITRVPGKDLTKLLGLGDDAWSALPRSADAYFMQRVHGASAALGLCHTRVVRYGTCAESRIDGLTVPIDPAQPMAFLDGPAVKGTSGSLVVGDGGAQRVALGVVTASAASRTLVSWCTLEDVARARAALWVERAGVRGAPCFGAACREALVESPHRNSWVNYAAGVCFAGELLGYSRVRETPSMSLAETAFYPALRPFVERYRAWYAAPAVGTAPVLVDGRVEYRSTYMTVARAFIPRAPPPGALVEAARREFFGAFPDPPDWVRPLTLEEAVFGVPGVYARVEPGTSSGQWGGAKRRWIDFERKEIHPQLRAAVHRFIEGLPELDVSALFFSYKHKDECRSQQRVADFKTRFFNVGDLDVFLAMRMLFLPWLKWLRVLPMDVTECAVGINAVSEQWARMHASLDSFSAFKICGDFSDYDKVADPIFSVAVASGVNEVLARGRGYDERARLALSNIIVMCSFPVTKIDEVVLLLAGTAPSGINGTTELNCHRGSLEMRVAFLVLAHEGKVALAAERWFRVVVRSVWYGDDHLLASRAQWFNQVTLVRALALWGERYTDATKAAVAREFTPPDEVTFLKRRAVWDGGVCYAPLEIKSVVRCGAYAVTSTAGPMARDAQAVPNMLRELWLHRDRALYDEVRGALRGAMPVGYPGGSLILELPTYDDLAAEYAAGVFATWDAAGEWARDSEEEQRARDALKLALDNGRSVNITNVPTEHETFHATVASGAAHCAGGPQSFSGRGAANHAGESVVNSRGQRQTMNTNNTIAGAAAHPQGTAPMGGTNSAVSESALVTDAADASNTFGVASAAPEGNTTTFATEPGVSAQLAAAPPLTPLRDDVGLERWWDRQIPVFSSAWSSVAGPSMNDVWNAYFSSPVVLRKTANFGRCRATLRLTILVGGTNLHYGKMAFRWVPRIFDVPDGLTRAFVMDATQVTSCAGVDVDACGSSTTTMDIPFVSPYEWIDLTENAGSGSLKAVTAMGRLYAVPLTNLRHVTLATPPQISITIYAKLVDPVFCAPTITTYGTVTSGREASPQGLYSRPLSTLSKGLATASALIPAAAPYTAPLSAMASAASSLASALGYSRPIVPTGVTTVSHAGWRGTGTASGNDVVSPAGLDPIGAVPPGGEIAGVPVDEMSIAFHATREALINPTIDGFLWNVADGGGTRVVTIPVTPLVHVRTSPTAVRFTPLGSVSLPFRHWRGTLRFRIRVVASKFHQGRLVIYYVPGGTTVNGVVPPTMLQSVILDLNERMEVELNVGYQSAQSMLLTTTSLVSTQTAGLAAFAGGVGAFITEKERTNGALIVMVDAPLSAPLTTNAVPVLVSVSAGPDFQLFHHHAMTLQQAVVTSGGAYDRGEVLELAPALTARPTPAIASEEVVHLRPLLSRYQIKFETNLGRPTGKTVANHRLVLPGRGWSFLTPAPGTQFLRPNVGSWFAVAATPCLYFNRCTPIDFFRAMFAGERGSARWRFHHVDYGTVGGSPEMAVSARPWCDPVGAVVMSTAGSSNQVGTIDAGGQTFSTQVETDAAMWVREPNSLAGVSTPHSFPEYYMPLVTLENLPVSANGASTNQPIVYCDVFRTVINNATTEGSGSPDITTNRFTAYQAGGDDYSLVVYLYPPMLTTPAP